MTRRWLAAGLGVGMLAGALVVMAGMRASAVDSPDPSECRGLPTARQLRELMNDSSDATVGGLFNGERMWAAVVNRAGAICAYTTSTVDPTQVWPGSQAIAKSKAYTANAFSLDTLPLSTARLYTFTQPGHSLWSLGQSNTFNAHQLLPPSGPASDRHAIVGGLIFFGGGVPLYRDGKIIGGLGVSGDTSCADHEIAKRVRDGAELNPPGGALADDIVYSPPDQPSVFAHPQCINTWRNRTKLANEAPASYPPGAP
jgi:uncharacterized protein GlcG (DUF336 family)